MDDILTEWGWKDPVDILKRPNQDYTPALPFIQEFENPGITLRAVRQSVTIGQYADFANFSDAVHGEIISEIVSSVAAEMSYKIGLSVAALVEATGGADGKAVEGHSLASIVEGQKTQPSPA